MSSPKTAKGKHLKGQTVLGDYFSKPNKSNKSRNSTGKKLDVKLSSTGTESKSKVAERKTGKTLTTIDKKKDRSVEKKADTSFDKKAGEEKRSSLKRKVTGAGMFTFSWTRGAQRDTEQYRNGYPDKEDDPDLNDNYKFYMNQIPSKPDGDFIDQIHVDWWGDYKRLEIHHGYIQWLFPIRESGLNWHAQELQLHEIKKLQRNKKAMKRILTSYKMMLNFYGMKLDNEDDGKIVREENWRDRFKHLNRSYHNYLRITRILKCLGEFGYEHLKKNFVKFILYEGLVEGTLSNVIDSCVKYWIGVLKDDDDREEVFDYHEKLIQDESLQSKRKSRSPSPPSYNRYWSNNVEDSKTDKKLGSKKGKDKKDEVDGDVENEFSDDGDGTLYYAMSLIDEDLPEEKRHKDSKTRKDHEMSDSGEDTDDHFEESQEMAHWNKEKESNGEELEGGSECDDIVSGKLTVASTDLDNQPTNKDASNEDIIEQNVGDNTEANCNTSAVDEKVTNQRKENDFVGSGKENKDENREKEERIDALEKKCKENGGLKSADETADPHTSNHVEMDTTEIVNVSSLDSDHTTKGNVEEESIESEDIKSSKPDGEVEKKDEENMET